MEQHDVISSVRLKPSRFRASDRRSGCIKHRDRKHYLYPLHEHIHIKPANRHNHMSPFFLANTLVERVTRTRIEKNTAYINPNDGRTYEVVKSMSLKW